MDEAKLMHKLGLLEALYAGAGTKGEKVAAGLARDRILQRLIEFERDDPPREYSFKVPDAWSRKVLVALLRRYEIKPYRYKRQRHTTVMAKVSKRFVDETLWPQYLAFSDTLDEYLSEVTDRVVKQVIGQDDSEADIVQKNEQLLLSDS